MPSSANAPYNGPGVPPQRRISTDGQTVTNDTVGFATTQDSHYIDPETLTPGIPAGPPRPQTQTSAPPDDPNAAASAVERDHRIGELIQALGEQDRRHQQQMEEMQFTFRVQMAAAQGQSPNTNFLPPDIDPDTPINAAQLATVLKQFGELSQASTIRAVLGIQPTEEAELYAKHPQLQTLPEPRKSEFLKEAVTRLRASQSNDSRTTPANGTRASQSVSQPQISRPAPRMTPYTETSDTGASTEEAAPQNIQAQLAAEYARAGQIEDKRERNRVRKEVMLKAAQHYGLSEEQVANSNWVQR